MLRAIIGYILGFISGVLLLASFTTPSSETRMTMIVFSILLFIANIVFAHLHHKKMRDKYYSRLKNGAKSWSF